MIRKHGIGRGNGAEVFTKMQRMKRNEHAVSPVVGVMLMLVVTIIIAAVVSAFAGGLAGTQQKAPQASIDVQILTGADNGMGGTTDKMTFTELSGDSIPTKDLAIVTYYVNKSGTVYQNKQTLASVGSDLYGGGATDLARVPVLNDMKFGYSGGNSAVDFGNYTWSTGEVMSTVDTAGTADLLAINDTTPWTYDSNYNLIGGHGIRDPDFGTGSEVQVKIIHIPSSQIIFNKEVIVQ
jgi:FlaG/FlaF family flagellin (archaellin)